MGCVLFVRIAIETFQAAKLGWLYLFPDAHLKCCFSGLAAPLTISAFCSWEMTD
jgi:hypothetical protein